LELGDCVVECGNDVEDEDEELQLGPVFLAENAEGKEIVVDLEAKPRPFHLSRHTLVLMEVLEGFGLLGSHVVELGLGIQLFLDLAGTMHRADFSSGSTTQLAVFLRETSLVPTELVNV
jgi:hypothetical protein